MSKTMLDYVMDSTDLIDKNIGRRVDLTESLVKEYIEGGYKNIWIVASGSSHNAAQCARLYMENLLGCTVRVISPFEFIHAEHNVDSDEMIVAISQSGYSTNTMDALKFIHDNLSRKSIVLTGDLSSDIVGVADKAIDFGVGEETVGYVTKGVVLLALYLMLFALESAKISEAITQSEYDMWVEELGGISGAHKKMIEETNRFYEKNIKALTSLQAVYMCSAGANLGTAMEGALKFGETIQVPGFAYELEEYIHGPNLQLNPSYTVFFVDGGLVPERTKQIFEATKVITDKAYFITNEKGVVGDGIVNIGLDLDELITPLAFLPFFQILSYKITEDTHRWSKHPLMNRMKELAGAKTSNYDNSPLRRDMPK